ncbi:MAG: ABC transporter substrate-binding protein [Chloroflexi bacterium]|nr:ABC transporter substrate-binding protein [Chloroflexota bacterium]
MQILFRFLVIATALSILLAACAPAAAPTPTPTSKPAAAPPAAPTAAKPAAPAPSPTAAAKPAAPTPAPAAAKPAKTEKVRVGITSPTGSYWTHWIAVRKGMFQDQALEADAILTQDNAKELQALVGGSLDVSLPSPPETALAIKGGAKLVMVGNLFSKVPPYDLIAAKNVEKFSDVKGKRVGVSSMSGATTMILIKILAANDLKKGNYDLVMVGGTGARMAAIMNGSIATGLIGPPQNFQVQAEGFKSLGMSTDYFKDYQFATMVVTRDWAQRNGEVLIRYLKAMYAASEWFYSPANKVEASKILAEETKTTQELAEKTWDLYAKAGVFARKGPVNLEGYKYVLQEMVESGDLPPADAVLDKLVDFSYLSKAGLQ